MYYSRRPGRSSINRWNERDAMPGACATQSQSRITIFWTHGRAGGGQRNAQKQPGLPDRAE